MQHSWHPHRHDVTTNDGRKFNINSCHHQRAYPFVDGCDFKLIAWAEGLSPFNYGESPADDLTGEKEAEIVFYNETNCLGIQHHPEWLNDSPLAADVESMIYVRQLVDDLVEGKL